MKKNNAKVKIEQVVQAILYRLKTGCQRRELPVKQFFDVSYSWNSVCQHFARWSKENIWENVKVLIFEKHKTRLDLSSIQLDGSQSLAKRGGESVGYQFRRKAVTSNMLFLCDNNGIPLSCSKVIASNHHDMYDVENQIDTLLDDIKKSNIRTDYLFMNVEAGFDAENLRNYCLKEELFANIDFNRRNGATRQREELLDKDSYKKGL